MVYGALDSDSLVTRIEAQDGNMIEIHGTFIYIYLNMYICIYMYIYIYMYICINIHMYICIYIFIYMFDGKLLAPKDGHGTRQTYGKHV